MQTRLEKPEIQTALKVIMFHHFAYDMVPVHIFFAAPPPAETEEEFQALAAALRAERLLAMVYNNDSILGSIDRLRLAHHKKGLYGMFHPNPQLSQSDYWELQNGFSIGVRLVYSKANQVDVEQALAYPPYYGD